MCLLLRFPTPTNQSLEVGQFRTSFHWRSGGGRGANVSLGIERFCKKVENVKYFLVLTVNILSL